jgi:hypothetical protein
MAVPWATLLQDDLPLWTHKFFGNDLLVNCGSTPKTQTKRTIDRLWKLLFFSGGVKNLKSLKIFILEKNRGTKQFSAKLCCLFSEKNKIQNTATIK